MNWKNNLIKFYESQRLDNMILKICKNNQYKDDLKQELIVILMSMDKRKLGRLLRGEEIYYWSYNIIKYQFFGKNSNFYKNYLNFVIDNDFVNNLTEDAAEKSDRSERLRTIEKVEDILNTKVDFFSAFLFRKYYFDWWDESENKSVKGRSYRKIEKEYSLSSDFKIDHMFIWSSVKDTLNLIKKELQNGKK